MATKINRNDKRREQTRHNLTQSAASLFVSKGYNETTVDEICADANVAKVTFYYHFQSKEEIVDEIKHAAARTIIGSAGELLSNNASAVDILTDLLRNVASWTEQNWQLWQVFMGQKFQSVAARTDCENLDANPLIQMLVRIVEHGKTTGEMRSNLNSLETASFILLAAFNMQVLWLKRDRTGSLQDDMVRCITFVMHGVAPAPPPSA